MKTIFTDTGPLVALCNPQDQHHRWAVARYAGMNQSLTTCDAVLSEALHLLEATDLGTEKLLKLWERGLVQVDFDVQTQSVSLVSLMRKYRDSPMALADACLVRMSELQQQCLVWTCDAHFKLYRRHGRMVVPLIAPWQS